MSSAEDELSRPVSGVVWLRRAVLLASLLVATLVLAGWTLDAPVLKTVLPGLTTMKANTALGILTTSLGLLAVAERARRCSGVWALPPLLLGATTLLLGGLTLIEYASGISVGLDELLFADPNTTSPPYPGRMSPATAVGFVGMGLAVMLLAASKGMRHPRRRHASASLAHLLAFLPGAVGYLSLAGYAFRVEGLYSFGAFVAVALHTAAAFVLLATGALLTEPAVGWQRRFEGRPVAHSVLVRLMPLALLGPLLAGLAVVWGARAHVYDPLYGPALFALAAAGSSLALAWISSASVRQAEGALLASNARAAESEARFRAITDAMPQMVWSARPDGCHDFYNERWYELTGTARQEVEGGSWSGVLHPDHRHLAGARWRHSLETGEPYEIEYRLRMADGAYRWVLGRALPLFDGAGQVTRWFGTCTDIEEIVNAREVLARSRLELEGLVEARTQDLRDAQVRLAHAHRLEALGQLAGGIAHDFNNVLQAVQGGASLIERRPAEQDAVRRLARMMFEAAERGAAITRRLLALSRRGDLRAEPLDPAILLGEMREILLHTLGAGVGVRVDVPAGLPAMLADRRQLETVLLNIATNARDAMDGNGLLTLSAAADVLGDGDCRGHPATMKPGPYMRLSATDTGIGMSLDVLSRVTEPFFTTKPQGKGTGLGLAMARGFAEQSGGGLLIESAPGCGTTVTLWFPLAQGELPPVPVARPEQDRVVVERRARVLLVDDDALVREMLAEQLEEEGYAVLSAPDGPAALALLEGGESVDAIISDLSMPGMDGLILIREVQLLRPHLPAILLTGFATNAAEIALGGALSGAFSLLRKPITGEHLAERVSVLLEGATAL